jgi:hypothetical protein
MFGSGLKGGMNVRLRGRWEVGGVVREVRLKRALVGFGEDEDE